SFADASADVALAVEMLEHIEAHEQLIEEIHRVLRPGGFLIFTTPNILSLRSRMSFLLKGYFYSFPSLNPEELDPVSQHISPFTLDRYLWRLHQAGLRFVEVSVDKYQRTS